MSEHSYSHVYSDEQQRVSTPRDGVEDSVFTAELRRAIATTREFFFTHQHPDGY
ncbi:MAG: hypothetical protein LBU65_07990 [Planctomycetaceae bacterium]|nr:hypothetical protein [Planctomycetaceae bacterium]